MLCLSTIVDKESITILSIYGQYKFESIHSIGLCPMIAFTERKILKMKKLAPWILLLMIAMLLTIVACDSSPLTAAPSEAPTETPAEVPTKASTEALTEVSTETQSETQAHVHVYGIWEVVQNASCEQVGKQSHTCTCGFFETEDIPATGHTEKIVSGKEADCDEAGYTESKVCSVCQKMLSAPQNIPAKGHTEIPLQGRDATCLEEGLTAGKKCSACDEVIQEQTTLPMVKCSVGRSCLMCGLNYFENLKSEIRLCGTELEDDTDGTYYRVVTYASKEEGAYGHLQSYTMKYYPAQNQINFIWTIFTYDYAGNIESFFSSEMYVSEADGQYGYTSEYTSGTTLSSIEMFGFIDAYNFYQTMEVSYAYCSTTNASMISNMKDLTSSAVAYSVVYANQWMEERNMIYNMEQFGFSEEKGDYTTPRPSETIFEYNRHVKHFTIDELQIISGDTATNVFEPGDYDKWSGELRIITIDDPNAQYIRLYGWAGVGYSSPGIIGYISGNPFSPDTETEIHYDVSYSIEPESAIVNSGTEMGAKSVTRFEILIPVEALVSEYLAIYIKFANGYPCILDFFYCKKA